MAEFKVQELEGTHYVEAHLQDETVRAEAGALSYLKGDIAIQSRLLPSLGGYLKSVLADEAIYRPTYTGTGVVTFESSLGGFHILDLKNEAWILEPGAYWASDGDIDVSFRREKIMTSIRIGNGLVYLQTRVSGAGQVVLTTRGPIEELALGKGSRFACEGPSVIGRTEGVSFKIRRPTKGYFGWFTSGEGFVRVYEGSGKILINPAPYWRYLLISGDLQVSTLARASL